MGRGRLTVAGMLAAVALAALGFGALRSMSDAWLWGTFAAAALGLNLAAFAALASRGRGRIVWGAFALAGGQYLLLSLIPPLRLDYYGPMPPANDSLAPTEALYGS
jgi:hypothetical protein